MCSALELWNTAVRAAGRAADAQELRGALCGRASAPSVLLGTRDVLFLLHRFELRSKVQDEPIVRARLHVMSTIVEM